MSELIDNSSRPRKAMLKHLILQLHEPLRELPPALEFFLDRMRPWQFRPVEAKHPVGTRARLALAEPGRDLHADGGAR